MMNNINFLAIRQEIVSKLPDKKIDCLDWLTFVIGLLPVVGKPAQVANKIINDHQINEKFKKLWVEIQDVNERLILMEDGFERISSIGQTIANNTKLQTSLSEFFDEVKSSLSTEFSVETSNWSNQEIINTLIDYDWVTVASLDNSSNLISNVNVQSSKTKFFARGYSHKTIKDSTFRGDKGSVGMYGEHIQRGEVSLSQSSIGYSDNSQMQMNNWVTGTDDKGNFFIGTCPSELVVVCPVCKGKFPVSHQELQGLDYFQCKLCGKVSGTDFFPKR
ncbi:MAG: hypothetical protein F6K24_16810 [Okeania sp. SIO2D1]|nr:hypothetical protein [Okeania sp. SIO2D1]